MHRICRERGWPKEQWRRLTRLDKIDLLAYDRWRGEQRSEIRKQLNKDDWGIGIESVMLAMESL